MQRPLRHPARCRDPARANRRRHRDSDRPIGAGGDRRARGIDTNAVVAATAKLTLEQSWKPDLDVAFHPGDALVRTVTRTATDIPALAMRELALPAPDGVGVYVDAPVSDDKNNRGTITGNRIDRATYVFETAGAFELPVVDQPWWNLSDTQAENATGGAAAEFREFPIFTTFSCG